VAEDGKYIIPRDLGTYAIIKEVEAGRGSPHGGAYLSFQHVPAEKLREAFGPVIDRSRERHRSHRMPVEVAPIAHYRMGGVTADVKMQTAVPGLLVRGEAVAASRANRFPAMPSPRRLCLAARPGGPPPRGTAIAAPAPTKPRHPDLYPFRAKDMPTRLGCCSGCGTMSDDVGPHAPGTSSSARSVRSMSSPARSVTGRPMARADMCELDWFDLHHAHRRPLRDAGRVAADRKPWRAPARGFPRDAALAHQPGDPAARRRWTSRKRRPGRSRRNERDRNSQNLARPGQDPRCLGNPRRAVRRGQSVLDGLR
jgi:hypothetical protein